MEVDRFQSSASQFPRVDGGGRKSSNGIGQNGRGRCPGDEEDEEPGRGGAGGLGGGGDGGINGSNQRGGGRALLPGWQTSSRIIRVSRDSGGKDRHSKVWTSRGLRDRRIRLSVTTAIQFYDIQDRLGYDQPSKAVEWLIQAAEHPISELPSLNNPFPNTPTQPSFEKRTQEAFDSMEGELDNEAFWPQQHLSLSKSACSSNSETSRGSGLSLSRPEFQIKRVKAGERAMDGAAMEKKKEQINSQTPFHHRHDRYQHPTVSHTSQNCSFTELLAGCIGGGVPTVTDSAALSGHQQRQWPSTPPMEYFNPGLLASRAQHSSGFSGASQLGTLPQSSTGAASFNMVGESLPVLQHCSLISDHLIPASPQSGSDFTVSPFLAGFNRGTLQSNFPSLWPQIHRHSPTDGSNLSFLIGAPMPMEGHHQCPSGFENHLHLCYSESSRLSEPTGKGEG